MSNKDLLWLGLIVVDLLCLGLIVVFNSVRSTIICFVTTRSEHSSGLSGLVMMVDQPTTASSSGEVY